MVPRITKKPEVRREELLDLALQLCAEVGYEAMSVESVTQAAGVAKGTFYHYFSSKQDLLFAMLRRLGDDLVTHLERQVGATSGTAPQRMVALMQAANAYKTARFVAFSSVTLLYRPENYTLRHRLFDTWAEETRAVVRPVITQGIEEGSFAVTDVESALDVLMGLWYGTADRIWLRSIAEPDLDAFGTTLLASTSALWRAQERVLGAPEGSFAVELPDNVIDLLEPFYRELKAVLA